MTALIYVMQQRWIRERRTCKVVNSRKGLLQKLAAGVQGGHVLLAGYKSVTICFSKNKYLPLRLGMRLAP